ncbi:HesA/MoeB/ThiF family protein [Cohnella caldifontis]|uniref:HesA/MoeB/ThiF family protein n=1 Tax=Cohnella caldifontis TaxID=3027471 RepID=UPI0023EB226B|nr:ThiF family adenylyltransferase [Cohnella sp. YIM B05605]
MDGSGARPAFKRLYDVRSLPGGLLRIGESSPNRAVEIEDEAGWVERLIRLMDGTRTIGGLRDALSESHPEVTTEDVAELVAELDGLGYVDDRRAEEAASLPPDEAERFKANLNYFSYYSNLASDPWHMQKRLRDAKITVIGAGALGCGVLLNLAGLGVTAVRIVDFDVVERSNLNRQWLYGEPDIGRRKIETACEFLNRFRSGMKLDPLDREIASADEAGEAILGSDFVVLAADQPYWLLERWVNEACVRENIPFIAGGMNINEGQLYTVVPGRTGCVACIDVRYGREHAGHASFVEQCRASDFRMPSTSIAPGYMILAGMAGGEIARWFTGSAGLFSLGRVMVMNMDTCRAEPRIDFAAPQPDCPVCEINGS